MRSLVSTRVGSPPEAEEEDRPAGTEQLQRGPAQLPADAVEDHADPPLAEGLGDRSGQAGST
jgi:hypothetical protein